VKDKPKWWNWDLELSPHLMRRMSDRGFNEVDLRVMMDEMRGLREDVESGRWVVETVHDSEPWEVVVEPDPVDRIVVVVTTYKVSET